MTNQIEHNERKIRNSQRDKRLSPDGLWRSYPKVPNLLCYIKSGTFYGRLKVNGKIIRVPMRGYATECTCGSLLLFRHCLDATDVELLNAHAKIHLRIRGIHGVR
jgi:hypothetical protein